VSEALKGWRPLFDPNFDPAQPTVFLANLVPKPVDEVVVESGRRVLAQMDGAGQIDVTGLRDFRNNALRSDKQWTLAPFAADPKLVLPKKE
jgi:hypothetical protein